MLNYQQPDEPLLVAWMGFSDATVARWQWEGMPGDVDPHEFLGLTRVQRLLENHAPTCRHHGVRYMWRPSGTSMMLRTAMITQCPSGMPRNTGRARR